MLFINSKNLKSDKRFTYFFIEAQRRYETHKYYMHKKWRKVRKIVVLKHIQLYYDYCYWCLGFYWQLPDSETERDGI